LSKIQNIVAKVWSFSHYVSCRNIDDENT